jgi:hypothetical protein
MFLFQAPPPTRFDLRFSIAGIPVRVHPLFWLIALLFGSSAGSPAKLLGWVIAIFISITIHEVGHALAMRRYGQDSQIILHMAGGLTVPESISWGGKYASVAISANQQILISVGRRNYPEFHIRVHSLSICFVPIRLGNFDIIFHEPALGKHLLGLH